MCDVRTPTVDRMLTAITANSGPGAAKTARSVLSGMFRLAVRHDALTVSPVREAAPVASVRRGRCGR